MPKKERLIIPDDLIKYMGQENYVKFINELKIKLDYKQYDSIWIIAENGGPCGL